MDKTKLLKEKIINLLNLPRKIDVAVSKKRGIRTKEKVISRFTIEEIEKALETARLSRKGQKIIRDFIEYLKSKGDSIFSSKPRYINIKFSPQKLDIINKYLKKNEDVMSFRSFIISRLAEEFGIKYKGYFFARSKDKKISSPQILIPEEMIYEIKQKLQKKNRSISDREVRKLIRTKIEKIIDSLSKKEKLAKSKKVQ